MKEIIHFDGKYFDPESELARPQYQDLVDIASLELNHKGLLEEYVMGPS
jgi:hypothetical protein